MRRGSDTGGGGDVSDDEDEDEDEGGGDGDDMPGDMLMTMDMVSLSD